MGIPFVFGFVVLGALSGTRRTTVSDRKILDWYASHSHRAGDIAGIFVLAVSAAFFLWFLGQLRATLLVAGGEGGRADGIMIASGTRLILVVVRKCSSRVLVSGVG